VNLWIFIFCMGWHWCSKDLKKSGLSRLDKSDRLYLHSMLYYIFVYHYQCSLHNNKIILVHTSRTSKFLESNLVLYFIFLGLVLNLFPQHGQNRPSHSKNTSHTWQRFCPVAYRPKLTGFRTLWRVHLPLQLKKWWHSHSYSLLNKDVFIYCQ
jgi:hypothetical protein